MKPTQTTRLVEYVRTHPQASSLEITLAIGCVNVTGRVSDARAQGIDIVCERRSDGEFGYRVQEPFTECRRISPWNTVCRLPIRHQEAHDWRTTSGEQTALSL